eukprot:11366875-Alexandrium_andersonii.AAC.1
MEAPHARGAPNGVNPGIVWRGMTVSPDTVHGECSCCFECPLALTAKVVERLVRHWDEIPPA